MTSTPRRRQRPGEDAALAELDRIRAPLFRELERLLGKPDYHRGEEPHACCLREKNQMRISPLEARAIARALRSVPELQKKVPEILRRLKHELGTLEDTTERQGFDCPLLEGTRCLVHHTAKPIGCTAWHPGRTFSRAAWKAFAERDELNDRLYGPGWKLRVIPLWLERVLGVEGVPSVKLRRLKARRVKGPRRLPARACHRRSRAAEPPGSSPSPGGRG